MNIFVIWWRGWWIFDGYWDILYLVITAIVAFLWKPNQDNQRYAFSAQLQDETEVDTTPKHEMESVQL